MDLDRLLDLYRAPLTGLLVSWGASWSEAVELAQDSFADAWMQREACRSDWSDPENFGRWLRGFAKNRFRNWRRARNRRSRRFVPFSEFDQSYTASNSDVSDCERTDALRFAISKLSSKHRQVVLMHYLEETSVKETASLLNVGVKTVEGRLYQARLKLRRMLEASGQGTVLRSWLCLSF